MDYTLLAYQQGQHLEHWRGQGQEHQQALNQVHWHHQAINSVPFTDSSRIGASFRAAQRLTLTLGTGPGDVCTCWERGWNMAICCEDLTATYSTFGAARLVRWGIHVIRNVIKILHWGQDLATCAHLKNVDGICYEELTATWCSTTKRWLFIELALLSRFLHWGQGLASFTHCWKNRGWW